MYYNIMECVLYEMCQQGNIDGIYSMIKNMSNSNDTRRKSCMYLTSAIDMLYKFDHNEKARDIMLNNKYKYDRESALYLTCIHQDLDMIKYLIENNANIHSSNNIIFRTVLDNGYYTILKYLLDNTRNFDNISDIIDQIYDFMNKYRFKDTKSVVK